MIKNTCKVIVLLVLFNIIIFTEVSAYSDDLFKFDLPSTYGNLAYQNMYVFADTDNDDRGMIIYVHEDKGVKKSVWDIDKSDLDRIIGYLSIGSNVISTDRKAKLGKEKAIKVVMGEDDNYIEIYVLASNKYIYMVTFVAKTQSDFKNSDYDMIKKSFKLKDRTTSPVAIYILIIIIIGGFTTYRKIKNPKGKYISEQGNQIDYKNMTEEDFKKMDEK